MIKRLVALALSLLLIAGQSVFAGNILSTAEMLPLSAVITSPETDSAFPEGSMVTFEVDASNEGVVIDSIQIIDGNGQLWATDYSSPWSLAVANLEVGNYEFYAVAYDEMSNTANSSSINITVVSNVAPTVNITSPSEGQSFFDNQTITFGFAPEDTDGSIQMVQLYDEAEQLIGETNSSPWNLNIGTLTPGTYKFFARAWDNQMATGESEMITIHIFDHSNIPPTVSIMSPSNGANLTTEDDIIFQINANDEDGNVNVVELFDGVGIKLGSAAQAPYNINIGKWLPGNYTFYAQALDDDWSTSVSEKIDITVVEYVNATPSVSLTNPTNGAEIIVNTPTTVVADATDNDGTISLVRFYLDGQLVLSDTEAPFEYEWTPSNTGNYNWQAIATDNDGALGSSTMISVDVVLSTEINELSNAAISLFPNPTHDQFQLELTASANIDQFLLTDLSGKILQRQVIEGAQNLMVSLEKFPAGIYFVQLRSTNSIHTIKVVKK